MAETLMQPCAAGESPISRGFRYAAGASLVLIALIECGIAGVMVSFQHAVPQVLYLLCTLALFVSAIVAVRERRRALVGVRISAVAATVMLLWSSMASLSGPSITMGGHLHDLTPFLAGMLLAAVLLPSLLRQRDSEAACNCQ